MAAQQRPGFDKFMADSLASSLLAVEDFTAFAERCQQMAADKRQKEVDEEQEDEVSEDLSEDTLARLVTRDSLIGVSFARSPD